MKITRLLTLLCLVSLVFVYLACQRDDYGSLPTPPPPPEKVQVTLSGRILDDQQLPVSGATVKAGNLTANTDLNGNFQIKNVTLDANAGFVKVEKTGFFTGSRTFKAIKGSSHFVSIQLIKKNNAGTFSSAAGGSITVPNGGTINFEAGSVINAQTNTAYTGTVSVSAFLLDPTTENFLEIMPGELRGIDENNKQVGLQSFGMMAVEMTGAGGERLQLAPSKSAIIRFPIAAAQQASAPATIAFWSFNDTTGLWKQEGVATRQGNEYIGKASHFSFWNCDAPFPVIDFKATIKDQNGKPLKGIVVVIKAVDNEYGIARASYTDSAGVVSGMIPSGRKLVLTVISRCNETLITKEIGPLSGTTDLGVMTATNSAESKVSFSGEILDCSGQPMQNGYADIGFAGVFDRVPIVNGVLNYSYFRCGIIDTKASFRITDVGNNAIGDLQEVQITGNSGDIGTVMVCEGTHEEYLMFTMDTINQRLTPPVDTTTHNKYGNSHQIEFKNGRRISFEIHFDLEETSMTLTQAGAYLNLNQQYYSSSAPFTIQITNYGAVGEFIEGTFSGTLRRWDGQQSSVSGQFRVKRKN